MKPPNSLTELTKRTAEWWQRVEVAWPGLEKEKQRKGFRRGAWCRLGEPRDVSRGDGTVGG